MDRLRGSIASLITLTVGIAPYLAQAQSQIPPPPSVSVQANPSVVPEVAAAQNGACSSGRVTAEKPLRTG